MRLKIIVEIVNPGGLYGNARPENFPSVNDYRNPVIAEAMKVLGYVNRFNRGIARVQRELDENGNPEPVFDYQRMGVFGVTVYDCTYSSKKEDKPVANKADENQNNPHLQRRYDYHFIRYKWGYFC